MFLRRGTCAWRPSHQSPGLIVSFFQESALRFTLACLELSDSAEGRGQVNEIKDAQPRFFHFLPSSHVGFEERGLTAGLEQSPQLCGVEKKRKKLN